MSDKITGFRNRTLPADLVAPYTTYNPDKSTGAPLDRALQVFLPEIYPIPGANEFNLLAQKSTTAVESNVDIGITLDLPNGNIGIIRGVNIYISNMLTSTVVSWNVLLSGGVASGFSNLSIFPRTSPFVSNSFDAFIRVPNASSVRVQYTNTDGGSYVVGASISGWYWPKTLGDLWQQKGGQI